jgi:hypothetical protein
MDVFGDDSLNTQLGGLDSPFQQQIRNLTSRSDTISTSSPQGAITDFLARASFFSCNVRSRWMDSLNYELGLQLWDSRTEFGPAFV